MWKSIEQLGAQLQNWDGRRRRAAAAELGERGEAAAVELLVAALGDAQADVRAEAARSLGRLGDSRAAAPLAEVVRDPYPQVRLQAAWALGQLRQPGTAEALVQELPRQRGRVIQSFRQALARFGELAQEPLLRGLNSPDPLLRQAVAETLGKLQAGWAVPDLIEHLSDENCQVRQTVAEALGRIGDGRAVEKLLDCLHDPVLEVRQQAVQALGNLGDPRALPSLRRMLYPWGGEAPPVLKLAVEETVGRIEEAKKGFTGRELMPVEIASSLEDRSLTLVEPPVPSVLEPSGRELSPVGPTEAGKKAPRWWPFKPVEKRNTQD